MSAFSKSLGPTPFVPLMLFYTSLKIHTALIHTVNNSSHAVCHSFHSSSAISPERNRCRQFFDQRHISMCLSVSGLRRSRSGPGGTPAKPLERVMTPIPLCRQSLPYKETFPCTRPTAPRRAAPTLSAVVETSISNPASCGGSHFTCCTIGKH